MADMWKICLWVRAFWARYLPNLLPNLNVWFRDAMYLEVLCGLCLNSSLWEGLSQQQPVRLDAAWKHSCKHLEPLNELWQILH